MSNKTDCFIKNDCRRVGSNRFTPYNPSHDASGSRQTAGTPTEAVDTISVPTIHATKRK